MRARRNSMLDGLGASGGAAHEIVPILPAQRVGGEPAPKTQTHDDGSSAAIRIRRRRASLGLEALGSYGAGLLPALYLGRSLWFIAAVLGVWLTSAYYPGATVLSPSRAQVRTLGRSACFALATVTLSVAIGMAGPGELGGAAVAVFMATTCAAVVRVWRRRVRGATRVLLVGDRVAVTALASRWLTDRRVAVVSICIIEPDLNADEYPREVLGAPVLDGVGSVPGAASRLGIDSVIVCPGPGFTAMDMRRLAWSLEHTPTSLGVVGVLDGAAPHRVCAGRLGGSLVMDVSPSRAPSAAHLTKAAVDRSVGALLLLVSLPLFLVLCVVIRLDSRGPGLFSQQRVGRGGRPFTIYKLRTMSVDAEKVQSSLREANESGGPLFKIERDPRITRVGGFLRRSSLDELPQLINIVRGEMSLIGPRPALPAEVAEYDDDVRRRLAVKPGLTGLWQVSGRSDLPWAQAVALDLHYVDNWRISDDVIVAFRTVDAVLRSRGAY